MTVLDASALLVFLQGEPGADLVEAHIDGSVMGAANWSEVAQRLIGRGADLDLVRALLQSYRVEIVPVTREDAEEAVLLRSAESGLPLGDRLCLDLAARLHQKVLTDDKAWGQSSMVKQIREQEYGE